MMFGGKLKKVITDISSETILCDTCNTLNSQSDVCSLCGSKIHQRTPYSVALTWAFILSATFFLIPANTLIIMTVYTYEGAEPGTIMDGVIYFFYDKAYHIAFIIFFFSIVVPIMKIVVLYYLLYIIHTKKAVALHRKMFYYKLIHFIGKWSVLDIFVVGIMIGLVQFQSIGHVTAGSGVTAFAMVVLLTIFATFSFDTRLLWDKATDE